MDIQTLFVAIGLGYGVLAFLLVVSERRVLHTPSALLALAYALACVGILLQSSRNSLPLVLAIGVGNLLALLGIQYQAWAVRAMSGHPTTRRLRLACVAATVVLGAVAFTLPPFTRVAVVALLYAALFALTCWAVVAWAGAPRLLRGVAVGLLVVLVALYLFRMLSALRGETSTNLFLASPGSLSVEEAFYTVVFVVLLASSFSLLLLSKRATDLQLEDALAQTQTILATLTTGVAIVRDERLLRVNRALAALLGAEVDDLEGQPFRRLFPSDEQYARAREAIQREMDRSGHFAAELALATADGGSRATWTQAAPVDWQQGKRRLVISVTDISELKGLQEELARLASRDDLTGLLNRRSFLERTGIELARSQRSGRPVCVAAIDLDRLKLINDAHGHAAGDQALMAFAEACRRTFRDVDVCARIGGDEFAVTLPDSDLAQGRAAMDRLMANLSRAPLVVGDYEVELGASVGVVQHEEHESVDSVLARADREMYAVKRSGGGSRPAGAQAVPGDAAGR